jgi:hypothetical protein
MEIKLTNIVIMFVVAVVLSMIIGYNIVSIIDKKISNVNINVPPVNIPKSNITIHLIRGSDGKYEYTMDEQFSRFVGKKTKVSKKKNK